MLGLGNLGLVAASFFFFLSEWWLRGRYVPVLSTTGHTPSSLSYGTVGCAVYGIYYTLPVSACQRERERWDEGEWMDGRAGGIEMEGVRDFLLVDVELVLGIELN